MNMASHIPYGYKIENGVAVIDETRAEQVRTLFHGYLSGLALKPAAEAAGLIIKDWKSQEECATINYLIC